MKPAFLFLITVCSIVRSYSQANRVFSGGEALNFGIVDLSLNNATAWTSDRSVKPGYFSLLENASYIGYSDQANVNGYIKKYGNTAFLFPVGNGKDLRTLEISSPEAITDAYATAWIEGDPSNSVDATMPHTGKHPVTVVTGLIETVSKSGQWDWQVGEEEKLGIGTTGNGVGLIITVSMPDMTGFADKSELRLVGWNGSGWVDLSGKATATGNVENSKISGTMIADISAVAIGKIASSPLIKILSFGADADNCNTILKWETSIENKTSIFIIEQSTDAINFHTISSISTSGSSEGSSYSKEIEQPFGIAYYRLKTQHIDGAHEYSLVVSVNNQCGEIENIRVYPNPVVNNENIHVKFKSSYEGTAALMITSNTGQRVMNKSVKLKPENNLLTIDIKNLIHGTYFISLLNSNGEQIGSTMQFIKQ